MIIIVSNPAPVKDEHNIIRQLLMEGLTIFHLRKKALSESEMRKFIEKIAEEHYSKIILHSHYHLVVEYGLKGIHVPFSFSDDVQKVPLSVSFHSTEEINQFKLPFVYGFLSPIFDSISKEGYRSTFDLNQVKQFLTHRKDDIMALGGIDEDRLETLKELGFSGIVLHGAIWQNEYPVEKFKRIKEKWLKQTSVY